MLSITSLLKFNSIRKKLLFYSLLLILIMFCTSFYSLYNARHILNQFDYMFINDEYLSTLTKGLKDTNDELTNYLNTKNTDNLGSYIKNSDNLRKITTNMSRKISYDSTDIMLKDIANMMDKYLDLGDQAVTAKRGRDVNITNEKYTEAEEISGYITTYINNLNLNQFHENTEKYFYIYDRLQQLQILNIILVAAAFILTVVLTVWFSDSTSKPIVSLAKSADEISKGHYDTKDVTVDTDDEISVMADAFNKMKDNIKNHIDELKYNAEMEAKLKDEKVMNLKMKNLLKNAELQSLQSQINPHFLFNTLNAGVQLAMIEDAEKTGLFLVKMSELFRYNLSKLDKPVTLKEEIQSIKSYIYLLKTRFGDVITFNFDIDENVLFVSMPALILQPIIENACIHGIGDMEDGGIITISVKQSLDMVNVIVSDNGIGMNKETIDAILSLNPEKTTLKKENKKGHTTGIGLDNVIKRLKAFYGIKEVLSIESAVGSGTSITLCLPISKEDNDNV